MKALLKFSKGMDGAAIRNVDKPESVPGEVVIQVQAAALCASDVHIIHDEFPCELPIVLGHEFTGIVTEVGTGVNDIAVGDAVVSENNPDACGTCPACRDGYPNICLEKCAIGFKRNGCFADYVRVPASLLHKVPDGISTISAALAEPLAVSVHAVEDRCGINKGDMVVVMGPGAIGLLEAQVARAEGAADVIIAGTDSDVELRLARAAELGFKTCNVQHDNLQDMVMALTDGFGADVVIEASGAQPAIVEAVQLLRRGGRMVVSGITGHREIAVPWDMLVSKAASVIFAYSSRPRNWITGLKYLVDGSVVTEELVSHRFKLEEWHKALALMERGECIRAVFIMAQED